MNVCRVPTSPGPFYLIPGNERLDTESVGSEADGEERWCSALLEALLRRKREWLGADFPWNWGFGSLDESMPFSSGGE